MPDDDDVLTDTDRFELALEMIALVAILVGVAAMVAGTLP